MNIQVIAEHSVDLDLIHGDTNLLNWWNGDGNVLDIGCRGFGLTKYFSPTRIKVFAVDIDDLKTEFTYYRLAISNYNGMCGINHTNDPQATSIKQGSEIPVMTIESFSKMVGVEKWDLIKMDIEGEEINVLNSAKHPLAKQVSVEFHCHAGKQTKDQIDELLNRLSEFYTIHNNVWEERHCAGFNYWDVLLIAK